MTQLYGRKLDSEKVAEENAVCRGIVKQVMDFGVNQRQLHLIIYLLALEIESHDNMREITALVKELMPSISLANEENE